MKSIDKSKKGEEKLICVNQNGQTIELSKDCVAGFQPLADGKEYFLAEILTQFTMPVYVQFVDPPTMGKQSQTQDTSFFNSSLGAIYLESSYTENIIIASTISHDGRRTVVTFPREIDIRLAVCEGMLQNTVAYAEICQALNHGMDVNNLTRIDLFSAFKPRNSVREYPYNELIDPSTLADTSETNLGLEAQVRAYAVVGETEPAVNDEKPAVNDEKPEVNDPKQEVSEQAPEVAGQKPEVASQQTEGKQSPDYMNVNENGTGGKQPPVKPQRTQNSLQKNVQGRCLIIKLHVSIRTLFECQSS